MNKFEKAQTLVNARHITIVTERLLVTARAEHIPRICNAIGFSSIKGFIITSLYLLRLII